MQTYFSRKSQRAGNRAAGFWLRLLGWIACVYLAAVVVFILPLRWIDPPVTAFMLQQSSAEEQFVQWTRLENISPNALLAVIASEDQRFLKHQGVDFAAIGDALQEDRGSVRGASTITQQLVKNLYLWPGRSLLRKGFEASLAMTFDVLISKHRILELYLNLVEFGPGVYGVGAASDRFFNKPASRLSESEAALLAAALPNPSVYRVDAPRDYMLERRDWIVEQIQRLKREGLLTEVIGVEFRGSE
jgi:monofunctional biosynthetic peptidoglycan transglycosylase